ncbi:MAG: hypothetical protein J6T58_03285 [Bacteroidales bacterium]|nr:hypothetical protein [Bacteroidales bacterium]
MKKFRFLIILALTAMLAASCYTDVENQLAALEKRVSTMQQRSETINGNIASLQTLVDKYKSYVYVIGYRPIQVGKEIRGYTISLSDGTTLTLNNGISKDDPVVGLMLGDDGLYYWIVTINGKTDFFYDESGQKVAASVASPIMKIVDGVWKVSFDNGYVWQTFDKAQGESGYSYIDKIETRGNYIYITLVSGQTVRFPTHAAYEYYLENLNTLNANVAALRAVYEAKAKNVFVRTVMPIVESGETIGYSIVFSDSRTIEVYNGKKSESQNICLAQHTDGEYYWAIEENGKTRWLYNDLGDLVKASPSSSLAPIFILDNSMGDGNYYWAYKYGENGHMLYFYDSEGKKVPASSTGVKVFASIEVNDSYVTLNPIHGVALSVPRYSPFEVTFNKTSVTVPSTGTASVYYQVVGVPASAAITTVTDKGYYASMTKSYNAETRTLSGYITITADASAAASSTLLVLVSDGDGHMQTYRINVVKG